MSYFTTRPYCGHFHRALGDAWSCALLRWPVLQLIHVDDDGMETQVDEEIAEECSDWSAEEWERRNQ